MIWKILEIEKTKDEELIKKAYRDKLRRVNPEDDEEGFKELRRAYEEALEYATCEENIYNADMESMGVHKKKNEVDEWIDKIEQLYKDVKTRIDENKWNILLKDPVCDDLDTELEAAEKLLVFFMSHSYMPQNIWKLVDKRFGYMDNFDQLKEKFPENYLEFIKWQIKRPSFIDYTLFDGKTDSDVDEYINKLYEVKNVSEERDLPRIKQLIKELKRFDVIHPFTQTEEARCLLIEAEQLTSGAVRENEEGTAEKCKAEELSEEVVLKRQQLVKEALSIMEELDFEYSDNPYIERIYAETLIENEEIEKAERVYDALLEQSADNYSAMLGKAKCVFLNGNAEEAKEQIEDILEDRVQDADSLTLLETVNKTLVARYESLLQEEFDKEICFKLGWCYYQQKKFKEGIELLDRMEETEDYDYINLRCRLYLASDNYDKAKKLAEKWLKLIEESEDDGTKEMQKRKNRLSLAHFSIGVCIWETDYKNVEEKEKKSVISEVVFYIRKAIEEETNVMVKLSYMEQLARFYLDAESYTLCIQICDEILETDRGFFPAYVHRQKAHYELKNAKEVIDDYFSCIEIFPGYAPPYVLAAEVFFAFDQYDDVEQVIEAAKEAGLESDSLELYQIRCIHYKNFSEENVKEALKRMEFLRERVMRNMGTAETDIEDISDLEKEYAILYWDLDDTYKTMAIVEEFIKEHPNNSSMLHLKADVLSRCNKLKDALEVCKLLVQLEPHNLYTKTKLGNCFERLEKLNEAIACYKEILEINPEYAPALRRMMYIFSLLSNRNNDLEQCKIAVSYATRFIEVTGSAEGYVERGNLYIDLYELQKAVSDCKKAIELDPDAFYAYNNLGCALLKLRQVDKAIVPLEQAVEMEPDKDHLPYLNLAECYVLKKEYDKAIQAYEKVLNLRPKASHLKKEIAKIHILKENYDKAISIYRKMAEQIEKEISAAGFKEKIQFYMGMEPNDKEKELMLLYCDIADVYRQAGDKQSAENYFKKIYSGYRKLWKRFNSDVTEKVAEYYRDAGQYDKALWIVEHAMQGHLTVQEQNTWDDVHLRFTYATILFELGRKGEAKKNAEYFITELLKKYGGEEQMLTDKRYLPMRLYDIGIMYICAGDLEKGRVYLEQIPECKLCVTCETCDCFEYYFGMGLIAEQEGRKEEAVRLYEKAIEIKRDYPCAKNHLDKLKR